MEWRLDLPPSLEARLEPNGDIGIYGPDTLLSGDIQCGDEKSAALLAKARANAPKTRLLYRLPAPVIRDADGRQHRGLAQFELSAEDTEKAEGAAGVRAGWHGPTGRAADVRPPEAASGAREQDRRRTSPSASEQASCRSAEPIDPALRAGPPAMGIQAAVCSAPASAPDVRSALVRARCVGESNAGGRPAPTPEQRQQQQCALTPARSATQMADRHPCGGGRTTNAPSVSSSVSSVNPKPETRNPKLVRVQLRPAVAHLKYPISIDPTIVVTSTADFNAGNNEGLVSTAGNALTRDKLTSGRVGAWPTTGRSHSRAKERMS